MPNLTWYGSPNFTPGRLDVEYVVIHWMDGYLAGADATFQNTARQTSAHYGVEDDAIHQYVDEANTAWHAGNFDANQRSIGIEHSAMPGRLASDATYASTIWLITGICQRYGLDPAVAILPHQHFTSTDCPGTMDLPRIIAGVRAGLAGVSTQSGAITPIQEGLLMALTDAEQAEVLTKSREMYELLAASKQGALADVFADHLLDRAVIKNGGGTITPRIALSWNDKNFASISGALLPIAQGIGSLKAQPAATVQLDVKALAAELAPLLTTNQAHQFIVALGQALPKQ